MDELNQKDPDEMVSIINPSAHDFSLEVVDIHTKNTMIPYTVKSRESLKLPRYAADCASERLAQRMASRKSGVLTLANHEQLLDTIRTYEWRDK